MSDLSTDIGDRLREHRKKLHMTQQDFADILHISLNFYGNIERGISRLSIDKLYILHAVLGIDITYLVVGRYYRRNEVSSIFADCPGDKIADVEQMILLIQNLYK